MQEEVYGSDTSQQTNKIMCANICILGLQGLQFSFWLKYYFYNKIIESCLNFISDFISSSTGDKGFWSITASSKCTTNVKLSLVEYRQLTLLINLISALSLGYT